MAPKPLGREMEVMLPEKRVRLSFSGRRLLTEGQKSGGLKRFWVLIRPPISTISDLARHIHRSFHLDDVRPETLTFSIDGYALPFFETVHILRDGDIIRVNRKDDQPLTIESRDGIKQIEDSHIIEKQPSLPDLKLLEYGNNLECDAAGYECKHESESDGNIVEKKRKRPNGKHHLKKKKSKRHTTEETSSKEVDGHGNATNKEVSNEENLVSKKPSSVGRPAQVKEVDGKPSKGAKEHNPGSNVEEENSRLTASSADKKIPSRSARRKKAKRQWLRKMACSQNAQPMKDQLPAKDFQLDLSPAEERDQHSDVDDDELIPVVLKPGHIRFEPVGKVSASELDNDRYEVPEETIKWNGTTCKRKGQKWGTEKGSVHKLSTATLRWKKDLIVEKETVADDLIVEKEIVANEPVDFENFPCLTGLPEDGDIIAYRLIELSASWCPDLTPFRVGKVSAYNSESTVITLVPVAQYPLTYNHEQQEGIEECSGNTSLYKKDGSLEIEFASLIDVRLLNGNKGNRFPTCTAEKTTANSNPDKPCIQEGVSVSVSDSGVEKTQTFPPENGHTTSWDEISRALDEKRAELSKQVDICTKKGNSGKGSWSYKALRRNALGPTIALLRAENNIS